MAVSWRLHIPRPRVPVCLRNEEDRHNSDIGRDSKLVEDEAYLKLPNRAAVFCDIDGGRESRKLREERASRTVFKTSQGRLDIKFRRRHWLLG